MEVKRETYTFVGPHAEKSAKFYDTCLKMHEGVKEQDPELFRKIIWESGHKFGSRVIGPNYASTVDGAFEGLRAQEAAEFADQTKNEIFDSLPVVGRRIALREAMEKVITEAEMQFNVKYVRW